MKIQLKILFNSSNCRFIWGTRAVEAQFQIETPDAPDPYPPNKRITDLGTLVVLSAFSSVTSISFSSTKCNILFQNNLN